MGVDAAAFAALAGDPAVDGEVRRASAATGACGSSSASTGWTTPRASRGGCSPTSGCCRPHPELREKVRLVQVAVPSRTDVGAYQEFRALVDGLVGRINGAFGTPRWVPVHYIFRGLLRAELVALYRAADVMLVTPLRDGMNLVAKEFVASRTDGDGVLVLSEFAGAAWELAEALQVNPYDVEGAGGGVLPRAHDAAARSAARGSRRSGRGCTTFDVHRWVASFLEQLGGDRPRPRRALGRDRRRRGAPARALDQPARRKPTRCCSCSTTTGRWCRSRRRPSWPGPTPRCSSCSRALAARPRHRGARRERPAAGDAGGVARRPADLAPRRARLLVARPVDRASGCRPRSSAGAGASRCWPCCARSPQRTPGSLVEVKAAALAWHYRMADQETGARRANELRLHLNQLLSNQPVEILAGNRVIEIRPYGVHKGRIVPPLAAGAAGRDDDPGHRRRPHRRGPVRRRCRRRRSRSGSGREIPRRGSGSTAWPPCASCCGRWWTRRGGGVRRGWVAPHRPMRIETLAVHAGHHPDPATGAVTPPIHLTTTFARDADGALPHGFIYARSDNPTRRELETLARRARGRRDRARLRVGHGGDRGRVPVAAAGRARRRAAGRLLRHGEAAARGDGRLGARRARWWT